MRFQPLALLLFTFFLVTSLNAETTKIYDIYVDAQFASSSQDGSKENPFSQLMDGIKAIAEKDKECSQVNLYIAPSPTNYTLEKGNFTLDGYNVLNLSITAWSGNIPCNGQAYCSILPVVDFTNYYLTVKSIVSFQLSNINVIRQNGYLTFTDGAITLTNLNFSEPFSKEGPFLILKNARTLNLKHFNITCELPRPVLSLAYEKSDLSAIIEVQGINVYSIPRVVEKLLENANSPIFSFTTTATGGIKTLNIKDVQIYGRSIQSKVLSPQLPALFNIQSWDHVIFSNFSMKDQQFRIFFQSFMSFQNIRYLEFDRFSFTDSRIGAIINNPWLLFKNIQDVKITNFNFSGNEMASEVGSNSIISIGHFNSIKSFKVENHTIQKNIFSASYQLFSFLDYNPQDITPKTISCDISNVNISNVSVIVREGSSREFNGMFSYLAIQGSRLESFLVDQVNFSNNKLVGRLFILQNRPNTNSLPKAKTTQKDLPLAPLPLSFTRITIEDNLDIGDFSFLYFSPIEDAINTYDCHQLVEFYMVQIDQLKIINNNFAKKFLTNLWNYEVDLFQIKETQINVTNSLIANNVFTFYDIIGLDKKPSTLYFINNTLTNNTFNTGSVIDSDYEERENPSSAVRDNIVYPTPIRYRYTFILNSTFSHIDLTNSPLITIDNGFFILHDNHFKHITFKDTVLIESLFTPIKLPDKTTYYINAGILKELALTKDSIFWNITHQIELIANQFFPGRSVKAYFSMSGNHFTALRAVNSKLVSLEGFGKTEGVVVINHNVFSNLLFQSKTASPLVTFDSLHTLLIQNNAFNHLLGNITILSCIHMDQGNVASLSGNTLFNSSVAGFLALVGPRLGRLEFTSNIINLSDFSFGAVSINIEKAADPWFITNNNITNTLLYPDPVLFQAERYAIISLSVKNFSKQTDMYFSGNLFKEVVLRLSDDRPTSTELDLIAIQTYQTLLLYDNSYSSVKLVSPGSLLNFFNTRKAMIYHGEFNEITFNSKYGLIRTCSNSTSVFASSFRNIKNLGRSGLLYLSSNDPYKILEISHCLFENLTSEYSLKADEPQYGLIFNTRPFATVLESTKEAQREMIKKQNQFKLDFQNCTIKDVFNGIPLHLSSIFCTGCVIRDSSFIISNPCAFKAGLIKLEGNVEGNLSIFNTTFPAYAQTEESMIDISSCGVNLTIAGTQHRGENKQFSLLQADSGTVNVYNSSFTDIILDSVPVIAVGFETSTEAPLTKLNLDNVNFTRVKSAPYLAENRTQQTLFIETLNSHFETNFHSLLLSAIFATTRSKIQIQNSKFDDLVGLPAILYSKFQDYAPRYTETVAIDVTNTIFQNLNATLGPAITILDNYYVPIVTVSDATFNNNSAFAGGAIVALDCELQIFNSSITNNKAQLMAPAILQDNKRKLNVESVANLIENNVALYQDPIKSEADTFTLVYVPGNLQDYSIISRVDYLQQVPLLVLTNVSSYELQEASVIIELVDAKKRPVPDVSPFKQVSFMIPRMENGNNFTDQVIASVKWTDNYSANISFRGVNIPALANQTVILTMLYTSSRLSLEAKIALQIRECLPGEYNTSFACQACPNHTFSLDPTKPCTACPANAICPGQSSIQPEKGYWNSDSSSAIVIKCRNDDIERCPNLGSIQNCTEGYTGPLCNACDFENGFIERGYLKCGRCGDTQKSLIYSLIMGTLYMAYQLFSINAVYEGNKKTDHGGATFLKLRQREKSFYIKSLLTYTQLMSILYLSSPEIYKSIGLVSQFGGDPIALIRYGTQCSMKALGIDYNNFVFYQTLLAISTPLAQFIALIFLILFLKVFKRRLPTTHVVVVALVYTVISYQPGITTNLTLFLSCTTQDGLPYSYIASHPFWTCESEQYLKYSNYIVKPSLLVWCILVPLVIFFILFKNKDNLKNEKVRIPLGVFYFDLKDQYYYWGIILMLLKLMLSLLAYELEQSGEALIFISLLLLWVYQSSLRMFRPYKTSSFNNFEVALINLLMFNIIATRYLLNLESESFISQISLVVSVVCNGSFLLFVVWKILSLTYLTIVSFVEREIMGRKISRRINLPDKMQALKEQNALL